MYKNIEKEKALCLKDLVDYSEGQVVSKTLVQNELVSMTVFSFDKGEEISSHSAGGDAMVTVLDGKGKCSLRCLSDTPLIISSYIKPPKFLEFRGFSNILYKYIFDLNS